MESRTPAESDTPGVTRKITVEKWAWLIGLSDADDARLLGWSRSFGIPPPIEAEGARLKTPAYDSEPRAMLHGGETRKPQNDDRDPMPHPGSPAACAGGRVGVRPAPRAPRFKCVTALGFYSAASFKRYSRMASNWRRPSPSSTCLSWVRTFESEYRGIFVSGSNR